MAASPLVVAGEAARRGSAAMNMENGGTSVLIRRAAFPYVLQTDGNARCERKRTGQSTPPSNMGRRM